MKKEWYIGIDFGTSNTCVIAYEASEGCLYYDNLWGKGIHDKFFNIPTLISQDVNPIALKESVFYVGEEASLHPILRPFKGLKDAAREITPDNGLFGKNLIEYPFEACGLDALLEMGNDNYSLPVEVRTLVLQFFKKVLYIDDKSLGINKDTVKKIVIGCPAKGGNSGCEISYKDTLKGLLAECFTYKTDNKFVGSNGNDGIITVLSEPELAGVTYLFSDSKRENKKVLVIDIGGGTTDFSVLEYKNGKVEASNIGSCEVAGNAIDDIIFGLLPEEIPHSRAKCKNWKEHLFAEEISEADGKVTITPYATEKLQSVNTDHKINGKDFYLYYKKPIPDKKDVVIGEKLELYVFDKISESLRTVLNKNKVNEINTVFFVGGTSIITPLREKLIDIITNTESSYCAVGFDPTKDVVTMFGNNKRTIKADWGNPLTVTCYNAVAIGACIKAMGDDLLRVKPKVYCKGFYENNETEINTIDKDLIIVKEKEIPFAYIYYNDAIVSRWKNRTTLSLNTRTIQLRDSQGSLKQYRISKSEILKTPNGLLIYAVLTKTGIDYKACSCTKDPSTLMDDDIYLLIQKAIKIEMELVV